MRKPQPFRGCRFFLSLGLLALAVGCRSAEKTAEGGSQWKRCGPFLLHLPRTVSWTPGCREGFDEELSGYHVTGDIASLRLRPARQDLPDRLVLAITTSPGMKPHLDHFRLTMIGGHIQLEPFNEQTQARVTWTNRENNTFAYVEKETYFDFAVVGNAVHVTFKPEAMELLKGECAVSWIDWYR